MWIANASEYSTTGSSDALISHPEVTKCEKWERKVHISVIRSLSATSAAVLC